MAGLHLRDPAVEAPRPEAIEDHAELPPSAHKFQPHQQPEARARSKNLGVPFSMLVNGVTAI
eukprot:5127634-Amphidinium_carterae.2